MVSKIGIVLLCSLFCLGRHDPQMNFCDGPYVEYQGNKVIVRSIDQRNAMIVDSFAASEKTKHILSVHFSNHQGWDFSLPFKSRISNEPAVSNKPDRIIAFSDIEGEFENFRGLLIANKVMDSLYNWTFGKGALIICGDLFDRGNDVAAELWLLYKLEEEAKIKGGYVHTILGNHDIMNMSGDWRYVQPRYFTDAKAMGLEYFDLYSKNSELGRWLRSKNIMEKIGDNLCMHGGISPEILKLAWPVAKINDSCRPFYDQGMHMENFPDKDRWAFFNGQNISPFWYRGYFMDPLATQGFIDSTLGFYKSERILVGHTIVETNVGSYYGGRVIGLDVNQHEGDAEGLLIEQNKLYRIDLTGKKTTLSL